MKMENDFKHWNNEIAMSRSTFHVLNLFTIQQLGFIRQQLGQLSNDRISCLPPTVISMLKSISPRICEKNIKDCLKSVKGKSSLIGHSSKKVEDTDNSLSHVNNDETVQMTDVYLMEQMLIENYIPSGLAREAAELYPSDSEQALSYCLDEENRPTEQSFLQLASTDGNR